MTLTPMHKWLAAGVLAVAAIPAVGLGRTHRPLQSAPSLMATSNMDAPAPAAATATPVALSATSDAAAPAAHKTTKHAKHHGASKLHSKKHGASKLHSKHRGASKLH